MNLDKNIENTFHLLNQVRASPFEFAERHRDFPSYFNGKAFRERVKTREGVAAYADLVADLRAREKNIRKLKWSFGLHMIADEQARRLGEKGLLTTEGTACHVSLQQRSQEYTVVKGRLSELYDFGGEQGEEIVEWLLMDDGLASRKRRNTLLDPRFQYVGIGTALHSVHGVVTVIVLAEDVISLVAPGQNGHYVKREPIGQGQVKTFKIEHRKLNDRNILAKSTRDTSTYNKIMSLSQTKAPLASTPHPPQ